MQERILETVDPMSWRKIRVIYHRFFDVQRARRAIRKVKLELAALAQMIETVTQFNKQLEKELGELRAERDDLLGILGQYKVVDPNAKCPGCGATDGEIETKQDFENQQAYVQHTCKVCKCIWPEAPVYAELKSMYAKPQFLAPGKPAGAN